MFRQNVGYAIHVLQRRWKWGVGGFAFGLGFMFLLLLILPRKYSAEILFYYREAPVMLTPGLSPGTGLEGFGGFSAFASFLGGGGTPLDDEIAYLSSMETFLQVAHTLPEEDIQALTRPNPLRKPIQMVKRWMGLTGPPRSRDLKAASVLRTRTSIKPVGLSRTLRIHYTDKDPERLLRILGAIKKAVLERDSLRQVAYYGKIYRALSTLLPVVEDSLNQTKQELASFVQRTGLAMVPDQQIQALAQTLMDIESRRAQEMALLASLHAQRKPTDSLLTSTFSALQDSATLGTRLSLRQWDSLVNLYTKYYQALIQGEDTASSSMKALKLEIQKAESLLTTHLQGIPRKGPFPLPTQLYDTLVTQSALSMVTEAASRARLAALTNIRERLKTQIQQVGTHMLDVVLLRARYSFFTSLKASLEAQMFQYKSIANHPVEALHLAQDLYPPPKPDFPRPLIFAFLGVVLGILLGAGSIFALEVIQPEVDGLTLRRLGLPVLGHIRQDPATLTAVTGVAARWLREQKSPGILGIVGTVSPGSQDILLPSLVSGLAAIFSEVWVPEDVHPLLPESLAEKVHPFSLRSSGLPELSTPSDTSRVILYLSTGSGDPWIASLLLSLDTVILLISRGTNFDVVASWMYLMEQAKTQALGWFTTDL